MASVQTLAKKPVTTQAPKVEWVNMTEEIARKILGKNPSNRHKSGSTIEAYTRDMVAGRWMETGEAIKVDIEGNLIDGQHRLESFLKYAKDCISKGKPVATLRFLVITGLEPESRHVVDSGRKRSASDALAIMGYSDHGRLAAAARWLLVIKQGGRLKERISTAEIIDVVERHPGLCTACLFKKSPVGTIPSLLSAIRYIYTGIVPEYQEEVEAFASAFVFGKSSYDDDAAICFRERIIRDKNSGGLDPMTIYIGTVYAFNLFLNKTPVKLFRIPDTSRLEHLDVDLI
jgi:hypothetical protein